MTNLMRHDRGTAVGDPSKEIPVRHKSHRLPPRPVTPWEMVDDLIALGQLIDPKRKMIGAKRLSVQIDRFFTPSIAIVTQSNPAKAGPEMAPEVGLGSFRGHDTLIPAGSKVKTMARGLLFT